MRRWNLMFFKIDQKVITFGVDCGDLHNLNGSHK